jgi:predicted HicB family RNase H-like nuclease
MKYKEYDSIVTFDEDARLFHSEVLTICNVITFQGTTVEDLEIAFYDSVDDYLDFCASRGELPDKPFSG